MLLVVGGIIGFGLAEYFSGGLAAPILASGGAGSMAALAVRSHKRASILGAGAKAGIMPYDEAVIAEYKAWLDKAMAGASALSAFRFFWSYVSGLKGIDQVTKSGIVKSFDDIVANPKTLYGRTADEVQVILGKGWSPRPYGKTGTGWAFENGDKLVFYNEGGIHKSSYWGFSSGITGRVKIVGKGYKYLPGDRAKIITVE